MSLTMTKAAVILLLLLLSTASAATKRPRLKKRAAPPAPEKIEGCHWDTQLQQHMLLRVAAPAWIKGGHSKHAKDCCFTNQPTSSDPSVCTKICDAEGEALILVADRNLMTCVSACGGNPTVDNGVFTTCRGTPVGSICTVTCDPSYQSSGEGLPRATCNADGGFTVEGSCQLSFPCFAGDTLVVVENSETQVAMRDVKTGQRILCVDRGMDYTSPAGLKFCEVANWLHAAQGTIRQVRFSFQRASGEPGSVTITPTHLVMRLTAAGTLVGSQSTRVDAFGAFETVLAKTIVPGNKIVLMQDPADLTAGYHVSVVSTVEQVNAEGYYVPAVASPYIVADGAIVPLNIDYTVHVVVQPPVDGAPAIWAAYLMAPLFTQKLQPFGTPGTSGTWVTDSGITVHIWPGAGVFAKLAAEKVAQGKAVNFAAAQAWFASHYVAWVEDPSKVVTAAEQLEAYSGPGMWVSRAR